MRPKYSHACFGIRSWNPITDQNFPNFYVAQKVSIFTQITLWLYRKNTTENYTRMIPLWYMDAPKKDLNIYISPHHIRISCPLFFKKRKKLGLNEEWEKNIKLTWKIPSTNNPNKVLTCTRSWLNLQRRVLLNCIFEHIKLTAACNLLLTLVYLSSRLLTALWSRKKKIRKALKLLSGNKK